MDHTDPAGPLNRFFDDFAVGDTYRFPLGRTISEADNTWFTLLTMNTNQVHFNAELAGRTEFGRILVNSGFSVALVVGMSVTDLSANATANLGWTDIELTAPLYVGDTVYTESLVTAVRRSASRPGSGIVSVITRGLNQRGEEFLRFKRSYLIPDREHRIEVFPMPTTPLTPAPPATRSAPPQTDPPRDVPPQDAGQGVDDA